jgi:hypothetical protein
MLVPEATDMTAALHLNPEGFTFQEVDSGEEIYDTFQNLRQVWGFHVFEGALERNGSSVLGRKMKTLGDV